MDGLTALALLLGAFMVSFYVSDKQAEKETNVKIIEQTQVIALPEIAPKQNFGIQWWREIYQSQIEYGQNYYLSTLSLGVGLRHIMVPYIGGFVKGFNLKNGVWEWSLAIDEQITTGVHMRQELGFIGGEDGAIIAFDNLSGKQRWRTKIDSSVISLSSGKDVIYAYSLRGRIYSINPQNGEIKWNYIGKEPTSNLYGASQVKEQNDKVYAGTGGGILLALDKDNGKLLWQRNLGQPNGFSDLDNLVDLDSNIITDEQTLYTATFSGKLYAINPRNQFNIWQQAVSPIYFLQQDIIKDFSANNKQIKTIIALTENSVLKAYNMQSGERIWQNDQARFRGIGQLIKYKQYWLGIDKKGTILLFNRQDGKLVNYYKSQAGLSITPVVKGNRFYWLDKKGQLFSMFLQDRDKTDFISQPTSN